MVFVLISLRNDESINYNLGNKKLEKQYREYTLKNKETKIISVLKYTDLLLLIGTKVEGVMGV